MKYSHTHLSVQDGSPAMFVSEGHGTITLVNEDGFFWTDPTDHWVPIPRDEKVEALLNRFLHWLRDEGWIKSDLMEQAVDITVSDFVNGY